LYKYSVQDNSLLKNGKIIKPNNEALTKLADYFVCEKSNMVKNGVDKKNQLRMYKHLANKIEPILNAWEMASGYLPQGDGGNFLAEIALVRSNLKVLLKWFSLFYNRNNEEYIDKYIDSLFALCESYSTFQKTAHGLVTSLLSNNKGDFSRMSRIFSGLVDQSILQEMEENISEFENVSISNIGVNSLALMELVFRIESEANMQFDFDDFDIETVSTVGKIKQLVEGN
jgi:acyl carrier protein